MTDYIEMCCICEVQHEGAEMDFKHEGHYCPTCAKECSCVLCGEFQLVPCGNHIAVLPITINNGVESVNDKGPVCLTCVDKIEGVEK